MECNLYAGQEVVCVDAMANTGKFGLPELIKGDVYKIRAIGVQEIQGVFGPELAVWLEGIYREVLGTTGLLNGKIICEDFGFRPSRFRPIVTRKTDITVFTNMLRDVHADA